MWSKDSIDSLTAYFSVSPEWGCVVGDNHQLGFPLTESFQCLAKTKAEFARFHHQSKARVDALNSLFLE